MLGSLPFELYQFAVAYPGWTKDEASNALGYTMRDIDAAITELSERRLLQKPAEDSELHVAMSPDVALAELVDGDERELQNLRASITARRRELSTLVPVYHSARKRSGLDSSVEVLEDPHQIQRLIIDYGRDVAEQVLICQPGQGYTADAQEESVKKDQELLSHGVVRRNIYHESTRDHMPTRKAVAALIPAGGEYRTLPHVPVRMMIFDQKLVVISRQSGTDLAALVIRDVNLIRIFTDLYNTAWDVASPFPTDTAPQQTGQLNSVQQSILKGMAAGYADENIARRLDLNVRTCRRHIAWMLEELGASSRFQAAIKAREAGWI